MTEWKVTAYGVRGSFSQCRKEYVRYGGNTTCFGVDNGDLLVLDAGTGIRTLGTELRGGTIHILISHLHLDHIFGLPGFGPLYEEGRSVHIYGGIHEGEGPETWIRRILSPPLWPAPVKAELRFHTVQEGVPFPAGDTMVLPVALNHPGGCLGYLLKKDGGKMAFLTDCELKGWDSDMLIEQCRGSDLAVVDASYLAGEEKGGYGHSSLEQWQSLFAHAEIRRIIPMHFSEELTDELLERLERDTEEDSLFLREGETVCWTGEEDGN